MKQLFDGTPVAIASEPDGSMRVDVPMTFSFDDKSNAPKPPLRAVMDKVARVDGAPGQHQGAVGLARARWHAAPRCAATCRAAA